MMVSEPTALYTSTLNIPYSSASVRNTVDVYLPTEPVPDAPPTRYWIVYIHGGGWRDPRETPRSFVNTLAHLDPRALPIAGIASVDYRLSEYPARFPSAPGSADRAARSASHPAHVRDVLAAVAWLQVHYGFGARYLLAGHSAGATMAFQAVMGKWSPAAERSAGESAGESPGSAGDEPASPAPDFELPEAVLGTCGIYDMDLLLKTHADVPGYGELLEAAFGTDHSKWAAASPVTGSYHSSWPAGRVAVVAPSRDDELVDFAQAEAMSERLWREKSPERRDLVMTLSGSHEAVWADGKELARAMIKALEMLAERDEHWNDGT